jgi:hypothetical protein
MGWALKFQGRSYPFVARRHTTALSWLQNRPRNKTVRISRLTSKQPGLTKCESGSLRHSLSAIDDYAEHDNSQCASSYLNEQSVAHCHISFPGEPPQIRPEAYSLP